MLRCHHRKNDIFWLAKQIRGDNAKFIISNIDTKQYCYITASNGAFGVIAIWSVGCSFRSGWFANMVSSFAFVVIKGPSLIKIISARNQDIIMVYEAVIKVNIYAVGLANRFTVTQIFRNG
jgi:hypothetical protein